jgi:N-acetylneuraminic acid mutarotase
MKKLLSILFLVITGAIIHAQTTETILYTWMSGPNTLNAPSAFGTKGVPSTTNIPASIYGPVSWSDNSGNFWLFGGSQSSTNKFNALFRYNSTTNEWTWMTGGNSYNNVGVYGTKGIPAAANTPGARVGAVTWKGADGNLYLYGGYGYGTTTAIGDLNDVWKFDVTTGQWAWIAGSNTINPAMVYGTMGVTTSSNTPNGRMGGAGWVDNNGVFWTYGGYNNANTRYHADLWKFETASGHWTYMGGSQSFNIGGTFGTKGVAAPTNFPGSRVSGVGVTDSNNNLWLFGGTGISGTWGEFNDLWKYDIALGQWTWVSGGNSISQAGTYGTKGVPNAANKPGSRRNALSWFKGNSIYLHGGWGLHSTALTGHLNDLWKFDIALG